MKPKVIIFCLLLFVINSFGHDQVVHKKITANATASARALSPAYVDFLNMVEVDNFFEINATNSLVEGSFDEDFKRKEDPIGGNRSLNHFYDPIRKSGLNDWGWPVSLFKQAPLGTNSFYWASISNAPSVNPGSAINKSGTYNMWSWQNARSYEWLGLTATNLLGRQTNLDNMFRAVGQVMHLLEDTSQPQHVRNEQHVDKLGKLFWESPIEDWGLKNTTNLNYGDGSKLDWREDGFTKLEDFWDRHLYNGSPAALNADTNGGTYTLGLAEWCNGNFIGDRHKYAEFYPTTTSDIRYYPHPALADTTQPHINPNNLAGTVIGQITLENLKQGNRAYLAKTNVGVVVTHHSAMTYFAVRHAAKISAPSMGVGLTIRDEIAIGPHYSNPYTGTYRENII